MATIDPKLLEILVCPLTKAPLQLDEDNSELICTASALAYPIREGIPVMLENEARPMTEKEIEKWRQ